jgi:hypothetical protein
VGEGEENGSDCLIDTVSAWQHEKLWTWMVVTGRLAL